MSYSDDLLVHAVMLMDPSGRMISEVTFRRAVSAAYYALFHQLTGDAVALIAPNVPTNTNYRIQRWFDHAEIKKICGRFVPTRLDQPLIDLIGPTASSDLQLVAKTFIQLQEARHKADYDLGFTLAVNEVWQYVDQSFRAKEAWKRLRGSAEANIFILSLLLWKNWEKDRP